MDSVGEEKGFVWPRGWESTMPRKCKNDFAAKNTFDFDTIDREYRGKAKVSSHDTLKGEQEVSVPQAKGPFKKYIEEFPPHN